MKEITIDNDAARLQFMRVFRGLTDLPSNYRSKKKGELHTSRKELHNSMEEILQRCATEKRDLTENEQTAYGYAEALYSALDEEIEHRTHIEKVTGKNLDDLAPGQAVNPLYRPDTPALGNTRKMIHTGKVSFRDLFGNVNDADEFRDDPDEFFRQVFSGRYSQALERRSFVSGDGESGGFLVPDSMTALWWDTAMVDNPVWNLISKIPMQASSVKVPMWKDSDHASEGPFGGMVADWAAEESTATPVTGKLRQLEFNAKKLRLYCDISREAIEDGLGLSTQVSSAMQQAISWYVTNAVISGNGVGKPLGILNSDGAISVTRQTASQVSIADIRGMFSRLAAWCQPNAVWLANYEVLPQLMAMADAGSHLVWPAASFQGVAGPLPQSLYGKPIFFSEHLPALGASEGGDLILFDPTRYMVGMRSEITIESSNAAKWYQDLFSFRAILRMDGMGTWKDVFTPKNGANTLSWCVKLK